MYGRKHQLLIASEKEEDANIWSSEIQAVIDNTPPIITKSKQCLERIKVYILFICYLVSNFVLIQIFFSV